MFLLGQFDVQGPDLFAFESDPLHILTPRPTGFGSQLKLYRLLKNTNIWSQWRFDDPWVKDQDSDVVHLCRHGGIQANVSLYLKLNRTRH